MKLPISAIIVSCNEGDLLSDCLKPLDFCNEVVVVDFESTDNTVEIAKRFATSVLPHKKMPIPEMILEKFSSLLKNEWILVTDPDEIVSPQLIEDIKHIFSDMPSNIGIIEVPWIFYFKDKRLNGTRWGGTEKTKQYLLHKERIIFYDKVHSGKILKQGYQTLEIRYKQNNAIKHYWMTSYKKLFNKHKRYLPLEGDRMHDLGLKYSLGLHLKYTLAAFKDCFFIKKGYKDGITGFFLSCFWMWYVYKSWFSLKKFEASLKIND